MRLRFPLNFITAPLIADLFLLAVRAIGRTEVHDGVLGTNSIVPIDIMVFFLTLAYIAISIDASGLIRWLAFRVLKWGGSIGHKLFFYLYAFFFGLGSFIGNDPIILSGTAFLAYMTRVSKNINHPKAWIFSQFAVANIASAILVSSNPTNLVLAGAFEIKFIHYTANMIVPVVITAIVLFPFLLYIVFADDNLIPQSIEMETLSQEESVKRPVNPNIPFARDIDDQQENLTNEDRRKLLPLEEIMNPFLDKGGAAFGAVIMTTTLVTLLALNAASTTSGEHPVFWVTLPAAFVMFCWDIAFGWYHRASTREIAREGRKRAREARAERERVRNEATAGKEVKTENAKPKADSQGEVRAADFLLTALGSGENDTALEDLSHSPKNRFGHDPGSTVALPETKLEGEIQTNGSSWKHGRAKDAFEDLKTDNSALEPGAGRIDERRPETSSNISSKTRRDGIPGEQQDLEGPISTNDSQRRTTLVSVAMEAWAWSQDTFPTAAAVIAHLPFALVPFAFAMFVLVQALVTKGWVQVFAKGWDHWVNKTGTAGAIGGMGFLSVCLCNVSHYENDVQ